MSEAGAVVALDPELDPEGGAEIRGGVERRRRVAEPDPREAGDPGKRAGHGWRVSLAFMFPFRVVSPSPAGLRHAEPFRNRPVRLRGEFKQMAGVGARVAPAAAGCGVGA